MTMEVNNMAAIRKALEMFVNHASCLYYCDLHRFYPNATKCDGVLADEGECSMKPECDAVFAGRAALAASPRNCDVGTAEEQQNRFREFCRRYESKGECGIGRSKAACPAFHGCRNPDCSLWWAQMAYTEGEKDGGNDGSK